MPEVHMWWTWGSQVSYTLLLLSSPSRWGKNLHPLQGVELRRDLCIGVATEGRELLVLLLLFSVLLLIYKKMN